MIKFCKLTKLTCPYHDMATYIALESHKDPYTTPLFCFRNGRLLTTLRLLSISTASSSKQAITPTHSFRIGDATSAAEAGASQATIQQLGRWHSQAYRHYICPPHKAPALCNPLQRQHLSLKCKHRN